MGTRVTPEVSTHRRAGPGSWFMVSEKPPTPLASHPCLLPPVHSRCLAYSRQSVHACQAEASVSIKVVPTATGRRIRKLSLCRRSRGTGGLKTDSVSLQSEELFISEVSGSSISEANRRACSAASVIGEKGGNWLIKSACERRQKLALKRECFRGCATSSKYTWRSRAPGSWQSLLRTGLPAGPEASASTLQRPLACPNWGFPEHPSLPCSALGGQVMWWGREKETPCPPHRSHHQQENTAQPLGSPAPKLEDGP